MKKYAKIAFAIALAVAITSVAGWFLRRHTIAVLQPAGEIGYKERNLIVFCAALSVAVVVPVFSMLGYFAWKYREGNTRAKYTPDVGGNGLAETIWWLIPTVLMVIISVLTWRSSYALDPFKPLPSKDAEVHVQVVALDWKWLFIYPDQGIATVNEAAIPVGKSVDFDITSDAVMTSFWAPQLGGQMYAMPGMSTSLHLKADKTGAYPGVAANISGKGFAGMKFTIKAMPSQQYAAWLGKVRQSPSVLTGSAYARLARPSQNNKPSYYKSVQSNLYDTIVYNYMTPSKTDTTAVKGMED